MQFTAQTNAIFHIKLTWGYKKRDQQRAIQEFINTHRDNENISTMGIFNSGY